MYPKRRLADHLNEKKRRSKTPKNWWLNKHLSDGEALQMEITDTGTVDTIDALETKWIAHYRILPDHTVTNSSDGGHGTRGWKPNEDTLRRMSEASSQRTWSAATIEKRRVSRSRWYKVTDP